MSNLKSVIYCPKCGEANYGVVHFCFSCGTRLANPEADNTNGKYAVNMHSYGAMPTVQNTGYVNLNTSGDDQATQNVYTTPASHSEVHDAPSAQAVNGYGAAYEPAIVRGSANVSNVKKQASTARATVYSQRGVKGYFYKTRACALILLAISVLMLLASFLPMVKTETSVTDTSSFTVSFSPTEILSLGIDSLGSASSEDYLDEYQNYISLRSTVEKIDFDTNLLQSQKTALKNYAKSSLKLRLMSGEESPKANLIVATIVSIAYIFASVLTFVFAFILCAFYSRLRNENVESFFRLVKSLVAIILVLLPVYMMLMLQTANFSYGFEIGHFGNQGSGLAWYGIIMVIVIIAAIGLMSARCFSQLFKKEAGSKDYTLACKVVALVCLILAVVAMFMPFAKIQLAAIDSYGVVKTESMSVSVNNFYELSSEDVAYLTSIADSYSKTELLLHIASIVSGRELSDSVDTEIFNTVAFRYNEGIEYVYTLIGIFAILSALIISLFVLAIMRLILSKVMIKRKKGLIIGTAACVLIYLVLAILVSMVCNNNIGDEMSHYVMISLGRGPILATIFTTIAIASMSIRGKKTTSREYDNPDVSYAPYVI